MVASGQTTSSSQIIGIYSEGFGAGDPVLIYGLCEPGTSYVRYVGKTKQTLQARLVGHLSEARRRKSYRKTNWVKGLLKRGLKPETILLDIGTEDNWVELERFYIKSYRAAGFPLTNETDGGEGHTGYLQTEETRLKRSKTNKELGRKPPSWLGKHHSADEVKRMSERAVAAGWKPPGWAGKSRDTATRNKISETLKDRGIKPKDRCDWSGRTHTEDTLEKMSIARKQYHERKRAANVTN